MRHRPRLVCSGSLRVQGESFSERGEQPQGNRRHVGEGRSWDKSPQLILRGVNHRRQEVWKESWTKVVSGKGHI